MPTLSPLTVLSWTTSSATVRKAGNETRSAFSPTALVIGSALFLSLACGAEAQDPTATQPRLTAPAISTEPPPAAAQPSASQPGAPALQDNAAIGDAQSAATGGVAAPEASAQGAVEVQASAPSATEGETAGLLEQFMHPAPRSDIPHDLSPLGMFMAAHWVVKGVMAGLALASLITWTVWLAKSLELAGARRRVNGVIKAIRNARTLSEALAATERRGGPAALMLREAALELKLSEGALDYANNSGVKERVSSSLSRIEAFAGRRMMRGTGALATIGSVGPFVGLFGTVWGIMNSFIGISQSQTTNLAVVAPGIAEALLATAIGLVAAIPAVVIYNIFARAITGYRQLLADAAAGVERLVSRDLDFRKVPTGARGKSSVSLMAGE
ncbi:outer membrane transport energization protein ExbB [Rhizobium sp. RU35A]|uniref:tonB-system energizer ExbB n=1 Tax=Rhizobium sp. RU35A TaxID=1907414 RepID=UPI000954D257|nr:tonB-system energizer ExbB [Rhizobium sp. RU35A]SIR08195.1 outer membrane transport energization protein ExbB [Rhizobium sp. RU35A]